MVQHRQQECSEHGLTKFSKHKNGASTSIFRCCKCQAARVYKVVVNKRKKAYDKYGRSCTACGYNKCTEALDFHHLDPAEKEIEPSKVFTRSWERIQVELDKCVLLCANCHREVHAGVRNITNAVVV